MIKKIIIMLIIAFFSVNAPWAGAQNPADPDIQENKSQIRDSQFEHGHDPIQMLNAILDLKKNLHQRILQKKQALEKSTSETEKHALKLELKKLDKSLAEVDIDFERIATGVDIGLFAEKKSEQFNWQDELVSLIEPGIMELKQMTVKARQKTKLKDELSFLKDLLPIASKAKTNLQHLIEKTKDADMKKSLKNLLPEWQGQKNQIQNKIEIVQMQLAKMQAKEQSLVESTQTSIKNFFKNRGFFLFIAVIACVCLVLVLRFSYLFMIKFIPGYNARYRPFHIRAMDLCFRIMIFVSILLVLIMVFYGFEDWVLLSLTIIFILGLGWAVKHTLPRFWHQSRLILNIGAVREGERIVLHGVPWQVKNINMFTLLENPYLGTTLRLPIENLLDKVSRPFNKNEPWFPCKQDEWVILADGTRGCVTSLSHETVELVQRGGAKKYYQTADFLAQSPLNLSGEFRLKIPFGISYDLQAISTSKVLDTLDTFIREKIKKEGYQDHLINLRVEFFQAGGSSLDIVVIADFTGKMAPLYNRISRAIQRWCVDACTENNWEIPFPQLTVHKRI